MTNKKDKFINTIYLKNQLVNLDQKELQELYKKDDEYYKFIETVDEMNQVDNCFLLLDDEFIEKVGTVLTSKRFEITDERYINLINKILTHLNIAKNYPYNVKLAKLDKYFEEQEEIRQLNFNDLSDYINTIAYDAVVYQKLLEGNLEDVDETLLFGSANYFLEFIPKLYEDENNRSLIQQKLIDITKKGKGIRHFSINNNINITIKEIQKVKSRKEE